MQHENWDIHMKDYNSRGKFLLSQWSVNAQVLKKLARRRKARKINDSPFLPAHSANLASLQHITRQQAFLHV